MDPSLNDETRIWEWYQDQNFFTWSLVRFCDINYIIFQYRDHFRDFDSLYHKTETIYHLYDLDHDSITLSVKEYMFKIKNYETYNNERKEASFCKLLQVSDRKHQKACNMQVTESKWQMVSDI